MSNPITVCNNSNGTPTPLEGQHRITAIQENKEK